MAYYRSFGLILLLTGGCTLLFESDKDVTNTASTLQVWAGGTAEHFCVSRRGTAKCWGNNKNGEAIGDLATVSFAQAESFTLPADIKKMSLSESHTCALLTNYELYCWGLNSMGQLGNATTISVSEVPTGRVPVEDVGADPGVIDVSTSGRSTCAVLSSGELRCFGETTHDMVAFPEFLAEVSCVAGESCFIGKRELARAAPKLFADVVGVSLGSAHRCARFSSGSFRCWGSPTKALGSESSGSTEALGQLVSPTPPVTLLAGGFERSCSLDQSGQLTCWGKNLDGQSGVPDQGQVWGYPEPIVFDDFSQSVATHLAVGSRHTCALFEGGALRCWGEGLRLGLGAPEDQGYNTRLALSDIVVKLGDRRVTSLATNSVATCVIVDDKDLICWGQNIDSVLGFACESADPVACIIGDEPGEEPENLDPITVDLP